LLETNDKLYFARVIVNQECARRKLISLDFTPIAITV